jgi:trimethylamine--corrinoid protein Co-methyltransferase
MGGVYSPRGVKQVIEIAEKIAGSPEKLRDRPFLSMITCVISPLKLDQHYTALLKQVARAGIPIVCPSEPLCGLTSPVTLAGNTVIQTADSLAAVMLTQLVNPGTPVIFGTVASSANFRDMRYLAGPIEVGILSAAQAQMARFYNLPFYAVGGMSDSKIPDAQAGYESAMTILLNALGGANFVHDAIGLCDFALTMSYEKAVIDNEIVGMALRAARGIEVNEETLAFDAIKKAGPGGNFMTDPATVKHMRLEHYIPKLANRDEQDKWLKSDAPDLRRKSSDFVREILSRTSEHRLDRTLVEKLTADYPELMVPGELTEVANR